MDELLNEKFSILFVIKDEDKERMETANVISANYDDLKVAYTTRKDWSKSENATDNCILVHR